MKKILLALTLVFALALSACSSGTQGSQSTDDGGEPSAPVENETKELVFGSLSSFYNSSWDPAVGWDGWAIESIGVGETLFRLDENYQATPWLAESATQQDSTTWVVTLRDDVKFHNGTDMTAEAVKKCFERTMSASDRWSEVIPFASLDAEGQTLTIHLERPAPNLMNDLCDPLWLVYDADGSEDYASETFYTGPYIPVSFSPNDEIVVTKNEDYWGDEPQLDRAVLETISDVDTLTMAFQNGEVDIVVPIPDESVPLFESEPNVVIDSRTSARVQMFRFNMDSPLIQDVNLRNAISYCIDREGYSDTIAHGTVEPSYGVFPATLSFGGTEGLNLTVDRFDVEAAKKLLEDAGYQDTDGDGVIEKDGQPVEIKMIAMSSQTGQVQLCEVLQNQLSQIGIKVNLEVLENISDARSSGQFDISCESYSMAGTGTAQSFISQMFTTDGSSNFGHYSNAEVDALVEELASLEEATGQDDIIKQINQHIVDDCACIFFAHKKFAGMYNSDTVGYYWSQPSEYYILDSSTAAK